MNTRNAWPVLNPSLWMIEILVPPFHWSDVGSKEIPPAWWSPRKSLRQLTIESRWLPSNILFYCLLMVESSVEDFNIGALRIPTHLELLRLWSWVYLSLFKWHIPAPSSLPRCSLSRYYIHCRTGDNASQSDLTSCVAAFNSMCKFLCLILDVCPNHCIYIWYTCVNVHICTWSAKICSSCMCTRELSLSKPCFEYY